MSTVESYYRDKRVVVFGASGFLGAHLVARLVPLAAHVTAFARGAASPALPALKGATIVLGDVRSSNDVATACLRQDVAFMFAGRSGAVASIEGAREDLDVNCGGLLTVLDGLTRAGHSTRVVFPGSRLQYGRPQRLPVCETDPLAPLVPYGLHKTMCEEYLAFYNRVHNLSYACARLTNPYGPWASPLFRGYNVLNAMIGKALAGDVIEMYGDGAQIRDYIFVGDVVELMLRLGSGRESLVVNAGSGIGHRMIDVANMILEIAGAGSISHRDWPPQALLVETGDFVADIAAARALGWEPRVSLAEGLRKTVAALREAAA